MKLIMKNSAVARSISESWLSNRWQVKAWMGSRGWAKIGNDRRIYFHSWLKGYGLSWCFSYN